MMSSNKLSSVFGITTFGESHGPAIGILFDSPIPNQIFPMEELRAALRRRTPKGKHSTARIEPDDIEILSGVFEGKTTGSPLCIIVRNRSARSLDYEAIRNLIRPGYADYSWLQKYHIFDYRGGGRASGRETVARVIAAELLKSLLKNIHISSQCLRIGMLSTEESPSKPTNPYYWPDADGYSNLIKYLDEVKARSDSVGGVIRVRAQNVPPGLGDPIYEKLSSNIAKAMLSIGSVRGILFGEGLALAEMPGSLVNDQFQKGKPTSNHHGGILGGVSTGQDIVFDLIIRPVSGIGTEQQTIDLQGKDSKITIEGRHDTCHLPRLVPVIEAMLIICLADALQHQRLIRGNTDLDAYREALDKLDEDLILLLARRREIVRQVKKYKEEHGIAPKDPSREQDIMIRSRYLAEQTGMDPDLVEDLMRKNLEISAL